MVNSVYGPDTCRYLPKTIEYFSELGVRQIYLNPDYSATWTIEETDKLEQIYKQIGDKYIEFYLENDPHYISLIDGKITSLLRGGYDTKEKCQMGRKELAFTPSGRIYPCERLVGDDTGEHSIGHVDEGIKLNCMACHTKSNSNHNPECTNCSLKDYCMNWCGCSNYFTTGYYNRVSPFLCASEKAAIKTAFHVFQQLESQKGGLFFDHVSGVPMGNSLNNERNTVKAGLGVEASRV